MTWLESLPAQAQLRPLEAGDGPELLAAYVRNRQHLFPYDPIRPESFWTLRGQLERLDAMLSGNAAGTQLACVMVREGRFLGTITLSQIVGGPFRSASVGYWVDAEETGRGLAAAAVAALCRIADQRLGLHRIEASTLPANLASQRVLAKNGFEEFGFARNYLHINGRWSDSKLFQRILNERAPGT
jgi:ribosomal-protein-alanine N-acetyltransferase